MPGGLAAVAQRRRHQLQRVPHGKELDLGGGSYTFSLEYILCKLYLEGGGLYFVSENKFCVVLFKIAHSGSGSHVMGVHIGVRVHLGLRKLDAIVQEDHLDLKIFINEIKT